ncbi:hypothetical protein BC332_34931 [Capsicum chinense]|nr:hypothetical protein BC332_34931 [Capsicum chinense]
MLPLVNDQIKSLYHAATQLVTLLIYPPEDLCVDQGKLSDILNCAEGLIAEVASAAYSFSVEKAEEVNPDKWIRIYWFPLTPSERTAARGEV